MNSPISERDVFLFYSCEHPGNTCWRRRYDFICVDACTNTIVKSDFLKAFEMIQHRGRIASQENSRTFPGVVNCLNKLAPVYPLNWIEGARVVFCKMPPQSGG